MLKKAAILDSDFIIKTSLTRNSKNESLSDIVLKLPYSFYCHDQNRAEITDHEQIASTWLNKNITAKVITCLSDLQILQIIKDSYQISQNAAVKFYADWLKQACDVFSKSFYERNYTDLEALRTKSEIISDEGFILAVQSGDTRIGHNNNLGEIKDTVLAIALTQCLQMKCINFCSDDKRARRSLLSFSANESFPINSISYMGFYWVAKQKKLLNKEEATDFLSGWKKICKPFETNVTIKEHINRKKPDYSKRTIDDLFAAIWNDEVVMMNDGYLVYATELSDKKIQILEN